MATRVIGDSREGLMDLGLMNKLTIFDLTATRAGLGHVPHCFGCQNKKNVFSVKPISTGTEENVFLV